MKQIHQAEKKEQKNKAAPELPHRDSERDMQPLKNDMEQMFHLSVWQSAK